MILNNVKRGDLVYVVRSRRGQAPNTGYQPVVAAGPKYLTVGEGYFKTKFHRDTGAEVTDYTADAYVWTSEEDYKAHAAHEALTHRAMVLCNSRCHSLRAFSDEQLTALIALLESA